jgi:HAD superfamily hydrolase (TIGR01450 family)
VGSELTSWALDLDGVIWRGTETVAGAPEAVKHLRSAGVPVAFVTNSAQRTPSQVAEKLAAHGIPDSEADVITAAMAAAELVSAGQRVLAIGSDGLTVALAGAGAEVVDAARLSPSQLALVGTVDAVAVGITEQFNYSLLAAAMRAIGNGARFIATNTDATFPAADGLLPGNGALVAAVETASGCVPEIAGKPFEPIAALVRARLGSDGLMVGDRPDTDGVFAETLGYQFGLVLTGVTSEDDLPVSPQPAYVAASLLALVEDTLGTV